MPRRYSPPPATSSSRPGNYPCQPRCSDPEQIRLAFAVGGSPGGYKVPGLLGLYWTASYLHDGGVAVGDQPESQLGLPGTLGKGVPPDPRQSLRALLDRDLRARVVAANAADVDVRSMHVRGIGHEFWVDTAAQFSLSEQSALLDYLLTLTAPKGP
jgi:hypothetical protein